MISQFQGFRSPNYTQVPDELFDELMSALSGAQLKVLLYIIRRTFGFKKGSDTISLSQITSGITTRAGDVLDHGTGLSQSTVLVAIKSLLAHHIICATKRSSKERGNEATSYSLHLLNTASNTQPPLPRKSMKGFPGIQGDKKQSSKKEMYLFEIRKRHAQRGTGRETTNQSSFVRHTPSLHVQENLLLLVSS